MLERAGAVGVYSMHSVGWGALRFVVVGTLEEQLFLPFGIFSRFTRTSEMTQLSRSSCMMCIRGASSPTAARKLLTAVKGGRAGAWGFCELWRRCCCLCCACACLWHCWALKLFCCGRKPTCVNMPSIWNVLGLLICFICICERGKGGNRAGLVSRVSTHLVRFWTPAAFVLSHVPVTCRGTVSAVAGEAVTESILAGLTLSLLRLVAQILVNQMCVGSGRSCCCCFCLGWGLLASCCLWHVAIASGRDASDASRTKLVYAFLQTKRACWARFGWIFFILIVLVPHFFLFFIVFVFNQRQLGVLWTCKSLARPSFVYMNSHNFVFFFFLFYSTYSRHYRVIRIINVALIRRRCAAIAPLLTRCTFSISLSLIKRKTTRRCCCIWTVHALSLSLLCRFFAPLSAAAICAGLLYAAAQWHSNGEKNGSWKVTVWFI